MHKSAGPVVFVSKMLGMIPVIWTEEQDDSDSKSYYNLYTFVIFAGNSFSLVYFKKVTVPQVLCKPHYSNSHLETAVCKWGPPN